MLFDDKDATIAEKYALRDDEFGLPTRLDNSLRSSRTLAAPGFYEWLGIKAKPFQVDYDRLSRKHPEYFPNAGAARDHVEQVLRDPDVAIPYGMRNRWQVVRFDNAGRMVSLEVRTEAKLDHFIANALEFNDEQISNKLRGAIEAGLPPRWRTRYPVNLGTARPANESVAQNGSKINPPGESYSLRDTADKLKGVAKAAANSKPVKELRDTTWWKGIAKASDKFFSDLQMQVTPMAVTGERGSDRARAIAKTFANEIALVQHRFGQIDTIIRNRFDPKARADMGTALDNESAHEKLLQEDLKAMADAKATPQEMEAFEAETRRQWKAANKGIDSLNPEQRYYVDLLSEAAADTWQRLGMNWLTSGAMVSLRRGCGRLKLVTAMLTS